MSTKSPTVRSDPSWGLVAPLRVRLRPHARISRQRLWGEISYTLIDPVRGQSFRLEPPACLFLRALDGRRTVGDAMALVRQRGGAEALEESAIVRLLSQLHNADLLLGDAAPSLGELMMRTSNVSRSAITRRWMSPLSIRIPLFDPTRLLNATQGIGRLLFSGVGFTIWLVIVGLALTQAAVHWGELTGNLTDRVLAVDNLLPMALAFVLAKFVHELGHGYAIRRWGGEVHDMGIMLLVLMPVPYVDASSSTGFPSKWQRMMVGAAGMYAELLLASLAMLLWAMSEPGLLRSTAFNIVFVASLSTLLFNANPLLRYDGYFMLCDAIDSPNLGPRANRYATYLLQRSVLSMRDAIPPDAAVGERKALLSYAIASNAYRMLVMFWIALFLAQHYFIVGVLLAGWVVVTSIVLPLYKATAFLTASPALHERRARALLRVGVLAAAMLAALLAVPVPLRVTVEGVLWPPPQAEITAGSGGFIANVRVSDGQLLCSGCQLVDLVDPELDARIAALEARHRALQARYLAEYGESIVRSQLTEREIRHVSEQIHRERVKHADLKVKAPFDGEIVVGAPQDLVGRFVPKGSVIAYVVRRDELIVRAMVRQEDVGLVPPGRTRARVRVSAQVAHEIEGTVERAVPSAIDRLPSMALSAIGGGAHSLDPQDRRGTRSIERLFEFQIRLSDHPSTLRMGQRAHVQLIAGYEPLGWQWWRRARQLFLRQLNV